MPPVTRMADSCN